MKMLCYLHSTQQARHLLCSTYVDDCRFVIPGLGKWKNLTPIPDITLESLAIDVQGEDKEGFLSFLRKILRWVPEERPTAGELVYDE